MTVEALETFGVTLSATESCYQISGGQTFTSPGAVQVEGDWSNAAFWLCAGAMQGGDIKCHRLDPESLQGDRAVWSILAEMGAVLNWQEDTIFVSEGSRRAVELDASGIPDLIPALSVVAAVGEGVTIVRNASRLRLKESDRLSAIAQTLNALGAQVSEEPDGLRIQGIPCLSGGVVDAWGDHRIAMMAAVASAACREPVVIHGAQAVKKSYPSFWKELSRLGKAVVEEEGT
jgi:3-phosphoshikimate 1-carboxyvinyltransferase